MHSSAFIWASYRCPVDGGDRMMASNQTDADTVAASVTALIPARDGTVTV